MSVMSPSAIPDFEAPSAKVLSPSALAHVVLRTSNLEQSTNFYLTFLGGRVAYSSVNLSFIAYDEEHHRIALIGIPTTQPKNPNTCGLEHIAFTFPALSDLLLAYRQRKARGIEPYWCVNHGPTTSIYYKDPDGNVLETQVDNFDTVDEANSFILSAKFYENPIGTDFNAEEMIAAIKRGESEAELEKRREIGPRGVPEWL